MSTVPFVLIHSPLLGTFTWQSVGILLRQAGHEVFIPDLHDDAQEEEPFWRQEINSVALPVEDILLVGHSGAGAMLPGIGERFNVHGYVFVDAVLLFGSASRLELMYKEDMAFAQEFEAFLQKGGRFPNWKHEHLQSQIVDADIRDKLLADMRPRSLPFFSEQIETGLDWDSSPCAYIQLSESYGYYATQAEKRQWTVLRRNAHHFEMLTNPAEIAQLIIELKGRFT